MVANASGSQADAGPQAALLPCTVERTSDPSVDFLLEAAELAFRAKLALWRANVQDHAAENELDRAIQSIRAQVDIRVRTQVVVGKPAGEG